jgi:hypothetical protein
MEASVVKIKITPIPMPEFAEDQKFTRHARTVLA